MAAITTQPSGKGLDPIESASLDELRALQLQRLQQSLQHAYDNTTVFRTKCDAQAIHPTDLRHLEDLSRFPFLTKQDFRANYPFGMFAVGMDRIVRIHASSGTTGKPVVVGYTRNDIDTWAGLVARSLYAAGGRPGDKVHIAYNYGLFTGGLGCHYGAEKLGCAVIPISGGQTERQAQLIADFDPDLILVTPSYLLNIADEIDRQGIDPSKLSLRVAVVGAEPWTEGMRQEINTRLHLNTYDIYGLTEVIGPGVAQECAETRDGPTLWEDHFYPEIINPDTGAVLPDGQPGELVLTSLTKQAMPVIRYRTRDLTRLLPGTARPMRRIERITGRSDDMVVIRGVNLFPTQVEEQLLAIADLSPHYLIEVRRDGRLDTLFINVEPRDGLAPAVEQAAEHELRHKIKTFVGLSAEVIVHRPGTLARSQGKATRLIDHRRR